MSKLVSFTKPTIDNMQQRFTELACELAKKYGIRVQANHGRNDDKEASFTIRFRVKNPDKPTMKTAELLDYPRIGQKFFLIKPKKQEYEIIGYNSKNPNLPIKARGVRDKKVYNFSLSIKNRIGMKQPPKLTKVKAAKPNQPSATKVEVNGEWVELVHKGVKMKVVHIGVINSHGKPYNKYKTDNGKFIHQIVK